MESTNGSTQAPSNAGSVIFDSGMTVSTPEDPYAFLSSFDTIFIIDDSDSRFGRSWPEMQNDLHAITPISTSHDDDDNVGLYSFNRIYEELTGRSRQRHSKTRDKTPKNALQKLFDRPQSMLQPPITFHVVRDLVHKAVLGNDFLMGSETMTKHRNRLSRLKRTIRTLRGLPMLFVNNIGAVTQRLQGMIMGDAIEALPDSGSEPNLLSLDYVVRRGMRELINTNNIRMIQFADGTVQKTMGSMWLNWAYASSAGDDVDDEWSEHFVEFHVLDGCAYDVILGQDVLEDTDAFVTHEKSLVNVVTCSEPSGLNLVTWASDDHHGQALLPGLRHHRREELERRAEAERNYRRMPRGTQRDAAVAEEEECQRRYDTAQLLPPISDVSSESDGGLVTTSSAVGAKFVDGRADPGRAASTRESLRTKLGRLRDVFPGGSGRHSVQGDVRVTAQRGVVG
ncbi:hypothetical protein QIS74_11241 [Colletotrichum tabaci]|uniref:Uncharacterized protein n=1 Tax=Colletotrichum tabaci TaxID=1209068 RepID=A0AAV9SXZ5_9PEZI